MEIQGKVGEAKVASGTLVDPRLGAYSEAIVNDNGLGRYFEAARYSRQYTSFVRAVTVATTHNTPIAAATATPVLGLLNPVGNTKAAVLQRIATSSVSGTPAGGQFVLNALNTTTAPTTGAGSIFNGLLSASASPQGSSMKAFNNTALTGMLPVIGNEIALVGGGASAVAITSIVGPVADEVAGSIIVPPGFLLALMAGTGVGTTWIVNASWSWAEIDWPL